MARAKRTSDHQEIKRWVETNDGNPAMVKGTGGVLRIDFGEPEEALEPVTWRRFFQVFDRSGVDFLYDPDGHMVKFVSRDGTSKRKTATRKKKTAARKTSPSRKKPASRKKAPKRSSRR